MLIGGNESSVVPVRGAGTGEPVALSAGRVFADGAGGGGFAQVFPVWRGVGGVPVVRPESDLWVFAFGFALQVCAEALAGGAPSALAVAGVVMVVVGLGFKLAAAPFHYWAPDVYQGAPATSVALVSAASKVVGLVVLVRFLMIGFQCRRRFGRVGWHGFRLVALAGGAGGGFDDLWKRAGARANERASPCWPTPRSRTPGICWWRSARTERRPPAPRCFMWSCMAWPRSGRWR